MHNFRKVTPEDPYATPEWGTFEQRVTLPGKERRFLTYIPDGIKPATSLVMVLGPNHSTAETLLEESGWKELADACKFILFFLEPENGVWNTDEVYGSENGDTAYVNAAFAKGCERFHYCIHESKNYLYGVKQGGSAAHMAALTEPALYAGVATIGAEDISDTFLSACKQDLCRNLDGFYDPEGRKGIRKGQIPMPVWVIDDPDCGRAERVLQYWIDANRAEQVKAPGTDGATEYVRTAPMPYLANQEKEACRVWHSEAANAATQYGKSSVEKIWRTFLSRHQRWMADPGGSLRMAKDPVRDLGMEYHFEKIGGWMREWYVYVPECVKENPEKQVPLVFALHGYSCTGEIYAGNSGWREIAKKYGFILVLPSAVPDPLGFNANGGECEQMLLPSWNFLHLTENGPDEFVFFKELLRRVCEEYPVDAGRVYATGHSQGSVMTQALALGMPELFAAVAPCSGVIMDSVHDRFVVLPELEGDMPVPIWMFAGQEEQWLLPAQPEEDNASGKTLILWHKRNRLPGNAVERFRGHWQRVRERWLDLCYSDDAGHSMLRYTQIEYFPHATMPEMSWRIWNEFFAHWSRTAEGLAYTENT